MIAAAARITVEVRRLIRNPPFCLAGNRKEASNAAKAAVRDAAFSLGLRLVRQVRMRLDRGLEDHIPKLDRELCVPTCWEASVSCRWRSAWRVADSKKKRRRCP